MKNSIASLLVLVALSYSSLVSCGTDNVFELAEKKDDKENAETALQRGNYSEAISSLEKHLKNNPNDQAARSMLASAYMGKAGVDAVEVAGKVAGATSGNWSTLTSALPEGNAENVELLQNAVTALSAIPSASRSAEQTFQLALAQSSLAVVIVKKTAGNGATISDDKVEAMSDEDATAVVTILKSSKETISGSAQLKSNTPAKKLSDLPDKILKEPGDSDAEKLRSYLQKNN
jgi:predicted small lipoprotein YifL